LEDAVPPGGMQQPTSAPNNLRQRVISAVVLGGAAVLSAWLGGLTFIAAWALAALAVWWEWTGVVNAAPRGLAIAVGWTAVLGMALALAMDAPAIALVCAVIGAGVVAASVYPGRAWALAGLFYASAVLVPVVVLRSDTGFGLVAIFWLFAVVWAEDTGAYFVGRLIGGPKLAVAISPNKTWAGAVGGTVAGVAAGSLVVLAAGIAWRPAHLVVAFAIVAAAQVGDLLESAVKRRFGVKDASALIPGHGGMMDRVDGLLFAATTAVAIGLVRGGGEMPAAGLLVW
jgi:phosphatidate cytidylyltransferase